MPTLFDNDSDNDQTKQVEMLNVNKEYAMNYSKWRRKEELNRLKLKYGTDVDLDLAKSDNESNAESSSSEDDDDDDDEEISEEFEKSFYKTLACLKNKDPKIYNKDVEFFKDLNNEKEGDDSKNKKKEKTMTLRDYERHIILDKKGKLDDEEEEKTKPHCSKFDQENDEILKSFKNALKDDDDEFFSINKSEAEKEKKKSYKNWLKGQAEEINEEEKKELKPLKKFWNDPNLDANEKFLRDYILESKYSDNNSSHFANEYNKKVHDSDENLSEDENNIEKQEEFEHKYNFRFEEPDEEFIKRYPRTLEGAFRKKDNKRALKRAEVKVRKEEEKRKKREELKQLKALKRKEIEEKLEKLKEITGNDDINLDVVDLDGDFDPDDYDKKMGQMFNDDYYAQDKDKMKPEFPEIDEELDIEQSWDNYDPNSKIIVEGDYYNGGADCEDPEFNMDADYDGTKSAQNEIESVKKRKRRRRSKFTDMISKEKPKFDPKLYPKAQEYFDEYYALDYEDMIGDLPCRFKYRQTVPNDYGLTIEEILLADDRELNKWISLKHALQRKDDATEYKDVKKYQQKAANEALKRKILPSLYKPIEEEENNDKEEENGKNDENEIQISTKKKRRRKKKTCEKGEVPNIDEKSKSNSEVVDKNKKNKKKREHEDLEDDLARSKEKSEAEKAINELLAEQVSINSEINKKNEKQGNVENKTIQSIPEQSEFVNSEKPRKKKKEKDQSEEQGNQSATDKTQTAINNDQNEKKKKKKKNKKNNKNIEQKIVKEGKKLNITDEFIEKISKEKGVKTLSKKKVRKEIFLKRARSELSKEEAEKNPVLKIENERLKAYGISNPTKFKNKLKYKKK